MKHLVFSLWGLLLLTTTSCSAQYLQGIWELKDIKPGKDTAAPGPLKQMALAIPQGSLFTFTDDTLQIDDNEGNPSHFCHYSFDREHITLHLTCGADTSSMKVEQMNLKLLLIDSKKQVTFVLKRKK